MNSKTWLTTFGLIAFLLVAACGYFCFTSYQKYYDSKVNWDSKVGTVSSLERKTPYPSKINVKELEGRVEDYENSVETLFKGLDKFQVPLNQDLTGPEFLDLFKQRVNEFRALASKSNFAINTPETFYLGFDIYAEDSPKEEIVPLLDLGLKASEYLLQKLVSSGADSLETFSRDLIPMEEGGPKKQEISTVHKYPVRMNFRASHAAFQEFMNSISNDPNYFYIIRVLKINNDAMEGPFIAVDEGFGPQSFESQATGEPATQTQMEEWGYPGEINVGAAAAAGYVPSGNDARVLMGQEKLNVFMVVDMIRFIDPDKIVKEEKSKSSSRRR